jgi:probable phosphoglycerate mutase
VTDGAPHAADGHPTSHFSPVQATQVVLVRHGRTEWTASGRHTGRTDVPLDDIGRAEAKAVADRLAGLHVARALSSPLFRARETASLAGFGDALEPRPELMEWDYGELEGLTTAEIRQRYPGWTIWSGPVPGGETAEQVGARADRILSEIASSGLTILVFSHGHFLRVLAARWLGLPPTDGRLFKLDTATVSVLGYEREQRVLMSWNQSCTGGPV